MSKHCNNQACAAYGRSQEGRHCAYCGELLVDDSPSQSSAKKEQRGDGISVSRVMNDSHDTISNNNTTIVLNGKSLEDLTQKERKASYRKFCSDVIENGIISSTIRKKLDLYALEIEISPEDAREIEKFVKKQSSGASYELNAFDRDNLDIIKANLVANEGNINDMLAKLEAMSTYDNDEVQFYHNMLRCISSPSVMIRKYEEREQDIYWLAFWAYFGFLKNGQRIKAEKTLRELAAWDNQSQDNLHLLQSAGALIADDVNMAGIFLAKAKNISFLLQPLLHTTAYIIKSGGQHLLSSSQEINFYLEKLFGWKSESSIYAQATYVAPIPDALRNRLHDSKPEITTSVPAPQSQSSILQPNKSQSPSSVWRYLSVTAIATAIVAVVIFFPKAKSTPVQNAVKSEIKATTVEPTNVPTPSKSASSKASSASSPAVVAKKTASTSQSSNSVKRSVVSQEAPAPIAPNQPQPQPTTINAPSDPIAELKASADAGDEDSQYALGMMYYEGRDVQRNLKTAFQYLKPLADAGYAKAYFPVADMYHRGQGVAKNREEAEKWYKKAADAGSSKARSILLNSF